MVWQTPKVDWSAADYLNKEDYNRWINNIEYLHNRSKEVSAGFDMLPMVRKSYEDYPYADEMNAIEDNLYALSQAMYPYSTTVKKTYYANQPMPNYRDFNRIESLLLERYELLQGQIKGRKTLSFVFGGGEF